MAETVRCVFNGVEVAVPVGTTVAAALANAGWLGMHRSVTGTPRGPVCGMGVCFECRVTIDGRSDVRSCMVTCANGMEVTTDRA